MCDRGTTGSVILLLLEQMRGGYWRGQTHSRIHREDPALSGLGCHRGTVGRKAGTACTVLYRKIWLCSDFFSFHFKLFPPQYRARQIGSGSKNPIHFSPEGFWLSAMMSKTIRGRLSTSSEIVKSYTLIFLHQRKTKVFHTSTGQ